ncbi:hypothetical protein VTK73DRAFT_4992 [Phialemonium thermophilum]|uniref:Uncharacterized protein n=1 Tax=Phialemonium thermophilum TaxID=223376 RepID=A0ABR3XYV4_9PEZI
MFLIFKYFAQSKEIYYVGWNVPESLVEVSQLGVEGGGRGQNLMKRECKRDWVAMCQPMPRAGCLPMASCWHYNSTSHSELVAAL